LYQESPILRDGADERTWTFTPCGTRS